MEQWITLNANNRSCVMVYSPLVVFKKLHEISMYIFVLDFRHHDAVQNRAGLQDNLHSLFYCFIYILYIIIILLLR